MSHKQTDPPVQVSPGFGPGRRAPPLIPPFAPLDAFAWLFPQDQDTDNSRNASGELGSSSGSNSLDDGNWSNTAEGGKEQQDGSSKQAEQQPPLQGQKSQQAPGPSPKSLGCGSENWQKGGKGGGNLKGGEEEEKEVQGKEEQGGEDQEQGGRPVLKKPDKLEPCPRCDSYDTKFCYYNNYNIKQPRHFCKNCQR